MHELTISGTSFLLNGNAFMYTGVSFFNAIHNAAFNQSAEDRKRWMRRFGEYGINVLRVWGQWDSRRGFIDTAPDATLYHPDGSLRDANVDRLRQILTDADELGMVVELAIFSDESTKDGTHLPPGPADRAVQGITEALKPHRNLALQVWNESSDRVLDHVRTIRSIDATRLVTNSPGWAGVLGDPPQNRALDYLTPHTSRQGSGEIWQIAPREIAYLIAAYNKPVVDDEPARNGTPNFGGPREATDPMDHILAIYGVWQAGGYSTYHHDMFQTGYGTPAIPPSGIPEPDFNPYHHEVFKFLAKQSRYRPASNR